MELTRKQLAQEWSRKRFRPAYMLFGEDGAAKDLALAELKKAADAGDLNTSEYSGTDDAQAAEIVSTAATSPMFSPRRLVAVRNVKFGAAAKRLIAEYLREPLETTILILLSPDRRPEKKDVLAAGVSAVGAVVLFQALREGEASVRLREEARRAGFELAPEAAEFLVEEAGSEWGILRGELEKLLLFLQGRKKAEAEDAAACLGYRREAGPFELPNAVERRDAVRAVSLLKRLLREGAEPFSLLYRITHTVNRQLKARRLSKSGMPPEQIIRRLRLPFRFGGEYIRRAGALKEEDLLRSLTACARTEVALKSKSWLDKGIELANLVLTACGKQQ